VGKNLDWTYFSKEFFGDQLWDTNEKYLGVWFLLVLAVDVVLEFCALAFTAAITTTHQ